MTRVRDSQRQRLYDAERAAFGESKDFGFRYETVAQCQARVDAILASKYWRTNFSRRQAVRVLDGRGTRRGRSYGGSIGLPRWARSEWVILHELAHEAHRSTLGGRTHAAHGPEYAAVYLGLVQRFMGVDFAERLLVEFAARNVRVAGKRLPRRKVTDEHRAKAAAQKDSRKQRIVPCPNCGKPCSSGSIAVGPDFPNGACMGCFRAVWDAKRAARAASGTQS